MRENHSLAYWQFTRSTNVFFLKHKEVPLVGRAREKPPMAPTKARVSRREKVVTSYFNFMKLKVNRLKVAGMEAPAPPSFHLVCRGFPSTDQTIALLYSPSCPTGGSEMVFLSTS